MSQLISCLGDVGSGKTLIATIIACYDSRPLYSNYEIRLANWNELFPETFNAIKKPSLAIIDEFYAWCDARLSGMPINRYMSYILFQMRKRGLDIIITDQIEGVVDTRFRQLTNKRILCAAIYSPDNLEFDKDGQPIPCAFEYWIFNRTVLGWEIPTHLIIPIEIARQFFPIYDSWEMINPIDDNLMYKVSTNKDDTVKIVDEVVEAMLELFPTQKITKGVVEDYCLREHKPHHLVSLVHNRLTAIKMTQENQEKEKPHSFNF